MILEALIHILLFILSFIFFSIRYKSNKQGFFLNFNFYILFYSLFYISLPSIVTLTLNMSEVGASTKTIVNTSYTGLFFVTVFFISYYFSKDKSFNINHKSFPRTKQINFFLRIINYTILLYVILIILLNSNEIFNIMGDRSSQSLLNTYIENKYKLKPLYILQLGIVIYLFLQKKTVKTIFILIPYVIYDLLLSGRGYIFMFFILLLLFRVMVNKPIKIKYIVVGVLSIAGIATIRAATRPESEFKLIQLLEIFYEFIFTWSTTHIVYESSESQDFIYSIIYSVFRLFPSSLYENLFGSYHSYTEIIISNNPLIWGLAGSIVSEALSFKNNLVLFIYPFLIVIYGQFMNKLLRSYTISGVLVFIIALLYLQPIFRWSFFETALYPFYILFFFNMWIIGIDILIKKRT